MNIWDKLFGRLRFDRRGIQTQSTGARTLQQDEMVSASMQTTELRNVGVQVIYYICWLYGNDRIWVSSLSSSALKRNLLTTRLSTSTTSSRGPFRWADRYSPVGTLSTNRSPCFSQGPTSGCNATSCARWVIKERRIHQQICWFAESMLSSVNYRLTLHITKLLLNLLNFFLNSLLCYWWNWCDFVFP